MSGINIHEFLKFFSLQFPTKNIEIAFKVCNFLFAHLPLPTHLYIEGGEDAELQISEISETSSLPFYSPLPIFARLGRPQKSSLYHMY